MPNHDLKNKTFQVPDNFQKAAKHTELSYENMKKIKSELDGTENDEEGIKFLNWIDSALGTARHNVDAPKRARMNIGAEGNKSSINGERNNFKKGTAKDAGANPTKIRNVKIDQSAAALAGDRVTYEAYQQELATVKYLIEYMDNKKQKLN